jgi:hypothetical protein
MKKSNFSNSIVEIFSNHIQTYLNKNNIDSISADDSATLLANDKILSNKIGPKPGFNFRQMLRDGRDKK